MALAVPLSVYPYQGIRLVKATLTIAEAVDRQWDVVVVGAGISGAITAKSLADQGLAVVLLDKSSFPRAKVCGGCINHRAQYALEAAGLGTVLSELGAARIETLRLAAGSHVATVSTPGYVGITRETLDDALVAAAVDSGAAFLPKTRARSSRLDASTRIVDVSHEDTETEIRARILIAADGIGGALANDIQDVAPGSRIGAGVVLDNAPATFEARQIHMACGTGGYVGLTRVEEGRIDMAAAFDSEYIRANGGLGNAAAAVFEEAGFPTWPELAESDWRGTPALTRRNTKVAAERMYVIGDAAGYVEPFTGEGIAWAVTTGLAVAEIVGEAIQNPSRSYERTWARRYKQIVTRRQYLCYTMAHALRHPRVMTMAIRLLKRMPGLARPLVASMNTPAPMHRNM